MKVLGIIPARGQSKSIPQKNLALLAGKPLLWYAIHAAREAVSLSRVVVSTDDSEIAEYAKSEGIQVIERPESLAQDETPMIPVLQHALSVAGEPWDAVCLLQPTCPLRRAEDIDGAWAEMLPGVSSVISYVDVGANHPARMVTITDNELEPVTGTNWLYPRLNGSWQWANKQDLPKVYIRSGDVYLVRTEWLLKGDLVGDKPRAYVIPQERHVNVDCQRDLRWAEFLMETACVSVG